MNDMKHQTITDNDQTTRNLPVLKLISLNTYWFGLSFMWNTLHPILLPAVLLTYAPNGNKNTNLGLLTFLGLVLAIIVQPLAGELSDRSKIRDQKRKPFIILGTVLAVVALLWISFTNTLLGLFLGYIALQVASNIAHGPMQAVIPDQVPDGQRGIASGLKNFMDVAGLIAASILAGALFIPGESSVFSFLIIVIAVLLAALLITMLTLHEKNASISQKETTNKVTLASIFRLDLQKDQPFRKLLLSRFIFLLGVYGIQTFAQYFIVDVLKVDNAVQATGNMMSTIALALVVCVLVSGWLADKIGAERLMNAAMAVTALGGLCLVFVSNMQQLTLLAGIIGAGMGFYLTSNWTLAVKLAPEEQAGRFMGLTNLATAGASALGRLEGPVIDLLNRYSTDAYWGYKFMFFFCFACSILSLIVFNCSQKAGDQKVKQDN